MGRADERRARQRGGRRAAPRGRRAPRGTGRTGIRRLFTWKKLLGTFFTLCLLGMGAFIVLYMMIDIPEGNADAKRQSNVYKYSDGSMMARDGEVNREVVDLARIPKAVQRTFVAAENKTFYQDAGVDIRGTTRGLVNTLSGKGAQGGSTITQQYVKNYYLTQDQTVSRKLKELVISLKLDREKSKDYILAGYINTSYYGRNAYGIQAAARAYYRVDAEDLTVEQGAYLAALLQAPSQYDWAVASETGRKLVTDRWNYVLDNMVEQGWLDAGERSGMKFPVPKEPQGDPGMAGQTGYLVHAANSALKQQLVAEGTAEDAKHADALVDAGGWTITLNIDKKKQKALEKAVKTQLTDELDPKKRKVDADIQAGAVSVDPKTGAVVAMYGGQDYLKHYVNNATRADYQPASTFKPVILAAALEEEAETQDGEPIGANTVYDGTSERQVVDGGRKVGFAPENEDDGNYGDITVQTAMNKSVNSVFAQMGVDVGMPKVMETAGKLGMAVEDLEAVPAQTLGSMGASPLRMAGVYATLDNHGKKTTPTIVKSAEHRSRTVTMPDAIGEQVISREAADTVTSVLTGVVDDGTARRAVRDNPLRNGQQVAGKTGTSDNNKSAWFAGFTPDLVTTVGLFGEDDKPPHKQVEMYGAGGNDRVNGGGYPARIWAAYTFGVLKETSEFDLRTRQGAAVKPTRSPSAGESPSQSPSSEPPSREPTSEAPTTEPPTQDPTTEPPTQNPTTKLPDGTTTPPPTIGLPDDPGDGDRERDREQ
ncbi:penicillin-binding protein [Streptomyces sp. S12]|uniref:Penicillin-binding protein n=2 Tax=unclassified Streptomyces TaxID=2593676 RepID=A0A6G3QYY7_9ACTN|nr:MULTISPECIES: transglycosylase domain-containing protein [unclassified Streptomyces]MBM7090349.1 penicillin-binding protein [Streptomyces sp. S12]NEA88424.1 penicillin-binding protein [Streptomyces sp. SID14436]NEC84036.1 penicillin-binding protein [Streptomyces sp. SID7958]